MNNEKTPQVKFENALTYGDQIEALVKYFADETINTFVLEQAISKINKYREERKLLLEKHVRGEEQ
jgi:hypothetical protein